MIRAARKGPYQYELIKKGGGGVSARDEIGVLCTKPVVNTRLKIDEIRRGRGEGSEILEILMISYWYGPLNVIIMSLIVF